MPNSDAGKAETYVTVVIATQRLVRYVMSRRHALCNVFAIYEASSIIGDPGCTFSLGSAETRMEECMQNVVRRR
jgi:hypothetical protein